jgi:hypothetical protein
MTAEPTKRLRPRGITFGLKPWTDADDEQIRARYRYGTAAELARDLGRSLMSIRQRAHRIGVHAQQPWTAADDRRLEMLWGLHATKRIANLLGRSHDAVYIRALERGLVAGERRGKESLKEAAKRTGYTRQVLLPILKAANVAHRVMSRCSPGKKGYALRPAYALDPSEVGEAIADHLAKEPVGSAARRRGVREGTLVRALKKIGITRPETLPRRARWRLDDETYDRAMAARRAA